MSNTHKPMPTNLCLAPYTPSLHAGAPGVPCPQRGSVNLQPCSTQGAWHARQKGTSDTVRRQQLTAVLGQPERVSVRSLIMLFACTPLLPLHRIPYVNLTTTSSPPSLPSPGLSPPAAPRSTRCWPASTRTPGTAGRRWRTCASACGDRATPHPSLRCCCTAGCCWEGEGGAD